MLAQVVPFSPASGLLEWCEDTTPLGEYLLGGGRRTGGAHGRYHQPGQLTFSDAMAQYNRDLARDAPSDPAKRCVMVDIGHAPCTACLARRACRGATLLSTCVRRHQSHAVSGSGLSLAGPCACVTLAIMVQV